MVEVIRTVSAVTDPLLAAGPNALTQSPTARALEAVDCVALTVVVLDVVSFSVCVLGSVGRFELLELLEVLELDFVKLPGEMLMPDTVMVDPLTPVTLPEAIAIEANSLRKLPLLGNEGRLPLLLPPRAGKPPPPAPVRNPKPPPPDTEPPAAV